jgi:hypothetical protein
MATLEAGVWLGLRMIAAGLAHLALTWEDGNRALLAATGVAIAVTDLGILLLPMQRIGLWPGGGAGASSWPRSAGPQVPPERRGSVRPRCVCGASRRELHHRGRGGRLSGRGRLHARPPAATDGAPRGEGVDGHRRGGP